MTRDIGRRLLWPLAVVFSVFLCRPERGHAADGADPTYLITNSAWACEVPNGTFALRAFGENATNRDLNEGGPAELANEKLTKTFDCEPGFVIAPDPGVVLSYNDGVGFRVMERDGPLVWICERVPASPWAPPGAPKISYLYCLYAFADSLVDYVTRLPVSEPIVSKDLP